MQKNTKCGEDIRKRQRRYSHYGYRIKSTNSEEKTQSTNENKIAMNIKPRKIIIYAITALIIILILIIFMLLKNLNSPEAQSEILINAIDKNDTQKLSTLLSTQNNSVDENEAKAYIKYIKNEVGMN